MLSRNEVDDEIARKHLVAPFPRAYVRPWDLDHRPTLERAALISVEQPVALSHVTALARFALLEPAPGPIHVTVPVGRHPIGRAPGLIVHRTRVPTRTRLVAGVRTVAPEIAIVRSWPLVAGPDRRAPAIAAVRNGLTTADELRQAASRARGLSGRASLRRLVELLASGCESELELWGYLGVFDVPGLRHGTRQREITVAGTTYRVDLAYDAERVAVEMDGYRYHSGRAQRERDMRRDTALASIGWLTLRFSHERLHRDVAGCRRDTLRALAVRRAA